MGVIDTQVTEPLRESIGVTKSLNDVAASLKEALVGPCSIVKYVRNVRQVAGGLRIFNTACILNSTKMFVGADVSGSVGAAGLTQDEAVISGLGEAAERYSMACIPWHQLVYGSKAELGEQAVGLDEFELFLDEQYEDEFFPFFRWTAETPIYWAKGVSLITGNEKLIPAPQVYIPYLYQDIENRSDYISSGVSSGTACHSDPILARLSGLYEYIERDAFTIIWTRKISRPRIEWRENRKLLSMFERHYADCGVDFHLFDLTLDIKIPTVFCIAQSKIGSKLISVVGCATRLNYREACAKAMLEAGQCMRWAHHLIDAYPDWKPAADYSNINIFQEHVMLYLQEGMHEHLDFLINTTLSVAVPEEVDLTPEQSYEFALSEVTKHGYDVVEIDISGPEIKSIGLCVKKIVIPGLAQLHGDHRFPNLGNSRYDSVPKKLNIEELCGAHRNPIPHPFP